MKKFVLYSENSPLYGRIFYVTSKENYDRRIKNAREINKMDGFSTAQEVIDYWVKWFGVQPEDFIVMCQWRCIIGKLYTIYELTGEALARALAETREADFLEEEHATDADVIAYNESMCAVYNQDGSFVDYMPELYYD